MTGWRIERHVCHGFKRCLRAALHAGLTAALICVPFVRLNTISAQTTCPSGSAAALPTDFAGDLALLQELGSSFRRYRTAHFSIISDAPAQRVRTLDETIEQTFVGVRAFADRLGIPLRKPAFKMSVVFFDDWSDYQQHARRSGFHVTEATPGFFADHLNRCLIFNFANAEVIRKKRDDLRAASAELDVGNVPATTRDEKKQRIQGLERQIETYERLILGTVVRHEIAHQVQYNFGFQRSGAQKRRWLREGLAMQFEEPGGVNRYRLADVLASFKRGENMDLQTLVGDAKHIGPGAADLSVRYARAWLLVYYLVHERPRAFASYLQAQGHDAHDDRRRDPETTELCRFEAAFGRPDAAFEQRLQAYAAGLHKTDRP